MDITALLIIGAQAAALIACVGLIVYYIFESRREKKEEAKKNYKDY